MSPSSFLSPSQLFLIRGQDGCIVVVVINVVTLVTLAPTALLASLHTAATGGDHGQSCDIHDVEGERRGKGGDFLLFFLDTTLRHYDTRQRKIACDRMRSRVIPDQCAIRLCHELCHRRENPIGKADELIFCWHSWASLACHCHALEA